MPQPTEYEPETVFWSFEAGQSWFPGHQLDAEFRNLDITLTEILATLELIQRDDGAVHNETIGFDQLTVDLRATIQLLTADNAQTIIDLINALLGATQPLDADLTALAALDATAGILVKTAANTYARRTLQQPAAGLTIGNPAGTAGDPTFALANDLAAIEALAVSGFSARTGADAWASRTLQAPAAGFTITNPAGVAGDPTFVLANDLGALEALAGTGFAAHTGASTWSERTLTAPAAGFTITNPAGVAGNPTFVLANDLAALEALASNGFAERTGTDTWQITGFTGTGNVVRASSPTLVTPALGTPASGDLSNTVGYTESIVVAVGDETTAITTGTTKVTWRMPYAFTVTSVRASLATAQTSGSIFTVDINEAGTTIISTKLTIDNTEKTSVTAATPPVISDASLADDAEMTIDIDQIGDGTAKGLKVTLIGKR